MTVKPTIWTTERIAELTALIDEDLSYSEIGRRMGLSKDTVIGKARRIATDLHDQTHPAQSTIARLDALNIFPGFGKCVFPEGQSGLTGFHFCGGIVADPMLPYCDEHQKLTRRAGTASAVIAPTSARSG